MSALDNPRLKHGELPCALADMPPRSGAGDS